MNGANQLKIVYQVENGKAQPAEAQVINEAPVSMTVNGEAWLTFMCTPLDLEALAVGFLFNEGLIQSREEIADVRVCPTGDNVDVWTINSLVKPNQWRRTTGCTGGVTSVDAKDELPKTPEITNGGVLNPAQIDELIADLLEAQVLYKQSGGVHTSLLTDGAGARVTAEDIGRHNTLDKIAGRCLLEDVQLKRRILLTTGRISSEMLQKAARLQAAFVISRTSPSSLSISLAERYGITLIGYARRSRFTIYTHFTRILPAQNSLSTQSRNISEVKTSL